jgi:hypothetical protein
MPRPRSLLAFAFPLAVASGLASPAFAQAPGQGPPMPLGIDLAKVPVGAWAEYAITLGQMAPMTSRMALVGKGADGNTVETTIEGGMMAMAGGKVVTDMVLVPNKEKGGTVKKMVLQMGANDPMEMPIGDVGSQKFAKPDPKTLVGPETVKVQAGTFKTKHYRDKTPAGDVVDYWIDDHVPPIGLVKLEGEQKQNQMIKGPIRFELTATGKGAKHLITKPAKPFDPAALGQQAAPGPAPAAPPPGAAPPAPPPKK